MGSFQLCGLFLLCGILPCALVSEVWAPFQFVSYVPHENTFCLIGTFDCLFESCIFLCELHPIVLASSNIVSSFCPWRLSFYDKDYFPDVFLLHIGTRIRFDIILPLILYLCNWKVLFVLFCRNIMPAPIYIIVLYIGYFGPSTAKLSEITYKKHCTLYLPRACRL